MGTLGTQIGAPSHIIKRPRLTKILDETEARIILLCAPAGYGKTTLAREWVATRDEPVLWYSGGPAMADVAALAVDLAELFAGANSELAERVRFLASRGEEPRRLAKALSGGAPTARHLVVVDDYHYAADSPEASTLFLQLVENTSFRLLLTSRAMPHWLEARRLVYGEATVLGVEALAFDELEASAVLPDANDAVPQARGWPAVIGLAAVRGDAGGATHADLNALYDFFAGELYDRASLELQEALFRLALGGDATTEVGRRLFQTDRGRIADMATSQGFATRDSPDTITIHPLLRGFLLRRLREYGDGREARIIRDVVMALSDDKRWDECLVALSEFPHSDLIALTLEAALGGLLDNGRVATVRQWIDLAMAAGLPDAPILRLARAELAVREGRGAEARVLAEDAASMFPNSELAARAHLAAARGAHLVEDTGRVIANARRAEELSRDHGVRVLSLWLAFVQAYEQQDVRVHDLHRRLAALARPGTEDVVRVACANAYLELEGTGAKAALATITCHEPLLETVTDPLLSTNFLYASSFLRATVADYDGALSASTHLKEVAEAKGVGFAEDYALLTNAAANVGLRRLGQARRSLAELRRRDARGAHLTGNATLVECKLRIAAGDLRGASLLLAPDPPRETARALHGEHLAYRGFVLAVQRRAAEAHATFAAALDASRYHDTSALCRLGQAIIQLQAGDGSDAPLETLRQSLELGYCDAVVTACRAFPDLAHRCAEDPELARQLTQLFINSRDFDLGKFAGLTMPRELRRRTGLSPRERDVYDLVLQGRTNREIAKALFISESTAKVHVRHIFEKLGVHNRAEAAASSQDVD